MIVLNDTILKRFFTEIFQVLRETDTNVIEIWIEFSKLSFLASFSKIEVKEFIQNFKFMTIRKGNYVSYIVINKISFIIEAIKILEFDIRKISDILNYSGFETLVQEILSKNGYSTIKNFRFTDKSNFKSKTYQKKYEIDIIGIYSKYILLVDAKQWRRKDSFSSINKAANLQYQRTIALEKNPEVFSKLIQLLLGNNINTKKLLPFILIPMMVTLEDSSIKINDNQIPIVSIYELNSFLQELYNNMIYFKRIPINHIFVQQSLIN